MSQTPLELSSEILNRVSQLYTQAPNRIQIAHRARGVFDMAITRLVVPDSRGEMHMIHARKVEEDAEEKPTYVTAAFVRPGAAHAFIGAVLLVNEEARLPHSADKRLDDKLLGALRVIANCPQEYIDVAPELASHYLSETLDFENPPQARR